MTHGDRAIVRSGEGPGRVVSVILAMLTLFGPISMDLYIPVLPRLSESLGATSAGAQTTIAACLVGLGCGQLIAGSVSDRWGRRPVLLVAIPMYVAASVGCAMSPSIGVFIGARFLQGIAGAAGLVVAQAAGRDLFSGRLLLRYYGRLTVLSGAGAIGAPLVGGQLALVADWRTMFWLLAAVGVAILVLVVGWFEETAPNAERAEARLRDSVSALLGPLRQRDVLAMVLISGFANAAVFAYLGGATFVLQKEYGLTDQQYSYSFAVNSLGYLVFGFAGARLSETLGARRGLLIGLAVASLGSAGLLCAALLHLGLPVIVFCLFALLSGVAFSTPPTAAIAVGPYPGAAGAVSSLLGAFRFGLGGMAAPLVGAFGRTDALSLGSVTVLTATAAMMVATWWALSVARTTERQRDGGAET